MKITYQIKTSNPSELLEIISANYVSDLKLKLTFSDKKIVTVNFAAFIKNSQHLEIKKYSNLSKFKKFKIKDGNLIWNDFDLIFPIEDLYDGRI